MKTAVDANIFIDLLTGLPADSRRAYAALVSARKRGEIITSVICFAEVARNFRSVAETKDFFDQLGCRVDPIERDAAFLAGKFFEDYRRRGGARNRILGDFLIAAHAQLNADCILSTDGQFFGPNFPRLKAVSPADPA